MEYSPYVGLDPATSVGLGHLVRVASLRSLLRVPNRIIGSHDARMSAGGLVVRRRLFPSSAPNPTVWVVDSGHIPEPVIRRKLEHPAASVVWIRRGLFRPQQAAIQAGYVQFADLILQPTEAVAQPADAVEELALKSGKLIFTGIAHAYQVVSPDAAVPKSQVFIALGSFEPTQQPIFTRLRHKLQRAGIDFVWSAHDHRPYLAGFPAARRVRLSRSLTRKTRCSGSVSEAGYNSVYEALHLGRPVLLLANETRGREAQRDRVALAKSLSPNVFDAADEAEVDAWLRVAGNAAHPAHIPPIVSDSRGFREMAAQIEGRYHVAASQAH